MTFFYILIAIKTALLGAVYGRVDGGGIAKVSEWVERSLIMFFFVLACAPVAGLWALCAYAGVVGIATGHGQFFLERTVKYLGRKANGERGSAERVDPFVTLFFGQDPRTKTKFNKLTGAAQISAIKAEMQRYGLKKLYWRNVFGMFCTGSLVGIPAAVVMLCFGAWIPAAILSLTGFAKATAYAVGYRLWRNTESAEFINGGLRNVLCMCALWVILAV